MQSLCKNHFLQQLYRKIDGAVLWSQNERNLNCIITFQTHSILQRFMLRFDLLQLDCNDHLFIYDGAHAVGTHKVSLLDFHIKFWCWWRLFILSVCSAKNPTTDLRIAGAVRYGITEIRDSKLTVDIIQQHFISCDLLRFYPFYTTGLTGYHCHTFLLLLE